MARAVFNRVIVIVLDGVGIGALPDAAAYGDAGSDTLGHVAHCVPLQVPTLRRFGLAQVADIGGGGASSRLPPTSAVGAFGRMAEASAGKDSVTGHWELMGVVLDRPFRVFPNGFPSTVIAQFSRLTGRGVLGNKAASGTAILDELGPEHLRTGALIVYTSADSVFQVAAHEAVVPLAELYRACDIAYHLVCETYGVGRVIARPFVGEARGAFSRTANRRDFVLPPPRDTLLDRLSGASLEVAAIGKIADLFAGRGISRVVHTSSDQEGMDATERQLTEVSRGLIFANLVDFDTLYGHRHDPKGYARNLERFDARLAQLLPCLRDDDLLIVTADHGNDPTGPTTDHAREYVPLFAVGRGVRAGEDLGTRGTFADVGQTLAELFDVGPLPRGTSFLETITASRLGSIS